MNTTLHRWQPHSRQAGFNLLELMVAIIIIAIVLSTGVPSFRTFVATNRMAAAANDILGSISAARAEAIKRKQPGIQAVTLCLSANWNTAAPTCDLAGAANDGWIVFVDQNANAAVNAGDTILQAHGPASSVNVTRFPPASSAYLQYGSNGFLRTVAGLQPLTGIQLCDYRGNVNTGGGIAAGRWIQIPLNGPGRPQLYRMQADIQGDPLGGC